MAIITNSGSMSYTVGTTPGTMTSNAVETDLNVTYAAQVLKGGSPDQFAPGTEMTYQVSVTNTGTGTLYSLSLTDNLGTAATLTPLTYVEGSANAFLYDDGGTLVTSVPVVETVNEDNAVFTFSDLALPAGYRLVLTYRSLVDGSLPTAVTSIQNNVTFVSAEGETRGVIYQTSAGLVTPRSTITMVKTANPTAVNPGDTLSYTFTLTNIGATAVDIDNLTDQLPVNFDVTGVSGSINGTAVTYVLNTDYTVSAGNLLTLDPAAASTQLSIAAASGGTPGVSTIVITGTVNA